MISYDTLREKQASIAVVGLGYVGLPLAVLLAKHYKVVGFDIDEGKVAELLSGKDRMGEVSAEDLAATSLQMTINPMCIAEASVVIVAVPTPVDDQNIPDMRILRAATKTVGQHMSDGAIIIYESTVYPGATEEVCIPILAEESGRELNKGFFVGYSPERVNPGDKEHTIDNIVKVVSGSSLEALDVIDSIYSAITNTHRASSLKVAEAAKIIENTQRDINIALMNELSTLFQKMNIDTFEVLEAAGTKWNFLKFQPGLVGGHCIGVDPYYLTYKAKELGHEPQMILAGRKINDSMPQLVANELLAMLDRAGVAKEHATCGVLGITFKQNVPDVRNAKTAEIVQKLQSHGVAVHVCDPVAHAQDVLHEYQIELVDQLPEALDVLILAVPHAAFVQKGTQALLKHVKPGGMIIDIKHVLDKQHIVDAGYIYWSL